MKHENCRNGKLCAEIERLKSLGTLTQAEKDEILHRMVEGLHALVFGTYSIQSGDYALKSLGDGGEIHEYVHAMLRLLPPRHLEQIQSGGDTSPKESTDEPMSQQEADDWNELINQTSPKESTSEVKK